MDAAALVPEALYIDGVRYPLGGDGNITVSIHANGTVTLEAREVNPGVEQDDDPDEELPQDTDSGEDDPGVRKYGDESPDSADERLVSPEEHSMSPVA